MKRAINWIFINNEIVSEEEANISITDRGFLFGEGIFTTIRVNQGKCEFLNEHLTRLHSHAKFLNFTLPEISHDWINELILKNQSYDGIWKLKIMVTLIEIKQECTANNIIMTLHPYQTSYPSLVKLCIFPHPFYTPLSLIKSLSYAHHNYAYNYAKNIGFDDAIYINEGGFLLETSRANIFWIDDRGCWIPDMSLLYLKGIILQQVIAKLKIPIHFTKAKLENISEDANVFICNSMVHFHPVEVIENRLFKRNTNFESILKKIF
ncbi:MAG: aminotransferase class IV [Parachlamydiaceae bacterium]|nr:aminotransferase class IV [Parachlamydiaceae bacterium]